MKLRSGFISNSSSTSFIITSLVPEEKTLVDFVIENPNLIEDFKKDYGYTDDERYTQENLIKSAEALNVTFAPNKASWHIFGDEDGTLIGKVFDYQLRYGGKSKSFKWRFDEWHR